MHVDDDRNILSLKRVSIFYSNAINDIFKIIDGYHITNNYSLLFLLLKYN